MGNAKINLKPELKIKVVWKNCERELGRTKPINTNYYKKLKQLSFKEIYVIYLGKNSRYSLYPAAIRKANYNHSIQLETFD